jgi:xanthine dehydrogenase YagS FAD-binding subunit
MKEFGYERPAHPTDALAMIAGVAGARFLGGGTNLVDLMKLGVETPAVLIDVTALPYDFVTDDADGGLRVGSGTRNSDLAAHLAVRRRYPALAQAVLAGASGQLRNMATVGGNLLQRTRCPYFQDVTKPCNKRVPDSGCPARDGEHHNLAILGGSDLCIATNPSDMAVALAAFDAVVFVEEPAGPRAVPIADFYRQPADEPQRETTLEPGALITAVALPALPWAANSRYRKARERASYSFAIGSVAVALDVADGMVRDVRIALGAVAPIPWRAYRAEQSLRGQPATEVAFREAADAELDWAQPLRDNRYKVPLVRNLMVRTLIELVQAS